MLKKLLPKSEFAKNVLTLMTGTTIAQALPVAISPILTRLYTPEDFGILALFMSLVSIGSIISTGRYELAIILPKKNSEAYFIGFLSILMSLLFSLIIFLMVFFNETYLLSLLNIEANNKSLLYFMPISVLLVGAYQSLFYWNNRMKEYKLLSKGKIIQNLTIALFSLLLTVYSTSSFNLIIATVLGQFLALLFLMNNMSYKIKVSKNDLIFVLKKYIRFPKFLVLAHGMNVSSKQSSNILLTQFFTSSVVGFFSLTQRIVSVPTSLVSKSIGDVFRQKASEEFLEKKNCNYLYKNTLKKLVFISTVPFVLLYIFAPYVFEFFFGKNWIVAGEYVRLLAPMYYFQFITTPLSNMFIVAEKQSLDLLWQTFLFISIISSLVISHNLFKSPQITILCFSIVYSIFYVINGFMTYKFSKGNNE